MNPDKEFECFESGRLDCRAGVPRDHAPINPERRKFWQAGWDADAFRPTPHPDAGQAIPPLTEDEWREMVRATGGNLVRLQAALTAWIDAARVRAATTDPTRLYDAFAAYDDGEGV